MSSRKFSSLIWVSGDMGNEEWGHGAMRNRGKNVGRGMGTGNEEWGNRG